MVSESMLGHYVFLKIAMLLVLIVGAPTTLWFIGIGNLKLGIPMLLVLIVAFIIHISAARQVKRLREMQCRKVDDNIKPV